jgi:Txe/YoeB family toxin of Txe-Axe toxin-antitoxin module
MARFSARQKRAAVVGSAAAALAELERTIREQIAQGRTPPKEDVQLLKSISRALDLLAQNPFIGDPVPEKLWPREFHGLPNLFRMGLSRFWRLLYFVKGDNVMIVSVVFEICNHAKYDKLFGYRKK